MAKVFQLKKSDDADSRIHNLFGSRLVDDELWHASINYTNATVCGIQLDGEDGVGMSAYVEGRVTCPSCRALIKEIQSIKNWR